MFVAVTHDFSQNPSKLISDQPCLAGLLLFEMFLIEVALLLDALQLVEVNGRHVLKIRPQLAASLFQRRQVVLERRQFWKNKTLNFRH